MAMHIVESLVVHYHSKCKLVLSINSSEINTIPFGSRYRTYEQLVVTASSHVKSDFLFRLIYWTSRFGITYSNLAKPPLINVENDMGLLIIRHYL